MLSAFVFGAQPLFGAQRTIASECGTATALALQPAEGVSLSHFYPKKISLLSRQLSV